MAAAKPQRMAPPPIDDDEDEPEVSREAVEREKRERERAEAKEKAAGFKRKSWYASAAATDTLAAAVEELHFETRLPKHVIVSELFEEAARQAPRIGKALARKHGDRQQ